MALTTGIGWPMLLCMAVLAEPMIRLLYGSQWGEAVVVAQILCLGGVFTVTAAMVSAVCVATGHHRLSLRLKLVSSAMPISFAAVGASVSLHALAWCLLGASVANTCIWLIVGSRRLRPSLRTLLTYLGRSAALSTSAVAVPLLLMLSVPVETKGAGWLIVILPLTAIATGLALLVCASFMRHPLCEEARVAAARIPLLRELSR